jgi:methylated-DNA-[protein]-cysteine S-methyltransferase
MTMLMHTTIDSPIGPLRLVGDGRALHRLELRPDRRAPDPGWLPRDAAFTGVIAQLQEYFAGARRAFDDVALALRGGDFERRVWAALLDIPYGQTVTYGEVAAANGAPGAARAVGLANARNPVAIIVPCHRVIGADGTLTGYGGGLERKRALLELEAGLLPLAAA